VTQDFDGHYSDDIATHPERGDRQDGRTAQVPLCFPAPSPAKGRTGVVHHFDRIAGPAARAQVLATAPNDGKQRVHIYGKTCAFTIEAGQSAKGAPVVYIFAAAKRDSRGFDWENKITVMLTPSEQLHMLAVALDYVPRTAGKHHGPERDKWFAIENQKTHLYLRVGQGKTVRAAPIDAADTFWLGAVMYLQVHKAMQADADSGLHVLLRQAFAPIANAAAAAAKEIERPKAASYASTWRPK